jgi:mono/diheme cytochrome c family protein
MTKIAAVFTAGVFVLSAAYSAVSAQATRSANEGIYTEEQATRGKAMYAEQCASCHGDNLEGSGPMPALAGPDFQTNWSAKTVGELFEKTHTTMPATAPGTLTAEQAADVVAYLLSVGKYPAGTTPLATTMETLAQFKLDVPGGAAGAPGAPAAPGAPGAPGAPPAPTAPAAPPAGTPVQ